MQFDGSVAIFVTLLLLGFIFLNFTNLQNARVAKLVDALCSGRSVRKDVLVRIQSRAQTPPTKLGAFSFKSVESPSFQKGLNENAHRAEGGEGV